MEEKVELLEKLTERIRSANELLQKLNVQSNIHGLGKLVRKINQEIRFLQKVQSTGKVTKEHLQSSNLIHLNALVERLLSSKDPTDVLRPFKVSDSGTRLIVDIVCDNGETWVKVIARKARALTLISLGSGEYGQKSVLDQARIHLRCAELHPHQYESPKIIFHFAYGIETSLSSKLEKLGIFVEGNKISSEDIYPESDAETFEESENGENFAGTDSECKELADDLSKEPTAVSHLLGDPTCQNPSIERGKATTMKILNLDVSTLLAYVSNMTNGNANFIYVEPLLSLQAEWERSRPLKPFLDKLFHGKILQVCRTAYKNFLDIIDVIGGPQETERTHELLERIQIIEDAVEGRILELNLGGKIKPRSRLVFATGEINKSFTVSANEGFVRAARMQGIECTVVLHEPRSLSELKEQHAQKIEF